MLNFAINNEMTEGPNLPPFLTTNPYIGDMSVMAKFRLSRSEREKQGIKGIGTILVTCAFCGSPMLISPVKMKRNKNYFCQRSCYANWLSENNKGENHPNWKGGKVKVNCAQCGKIIYRRKVDTIEHERHFCTKACDGKWRSENINGPAVYNWIEPIKTSCDQCGKEILRSRFKVRAYDHHFCSRACKGKWHSEKICGDKSYQWSGGDEVSRKRFASKPKSRINARMASAMGVSLKGQKKGRSWEKLAGYSCDELMVRLKKTMPKGYTWDDFMNGGLEIDHIIPQAAFNISSDKDLDFKRCWDIKNLQLLPKRKNRQKGSKIQTPFQMGLNLRMTTCS